jgi:hypothetical protein
MKKQTCIATLLLTLLFLAVAAFFANSATGQSNPVIVVESPVTGVEYTVESVSLRYSVKPQYNSFFKQCEAFYYLDGKYYGPLSLSGDIGLENLFNGYHKVTIHAEAEYYNIGVGTYKIQSNATVGFFVDTGVAPSVSISALPEYTASDVTLNVTTDMPVSKITYTIDEQANITVPNNAPAQHFGLYQYSVVLTDLADGSHTLTAYAIDAMGNTGVAEKNFTVKTSETQSLQGPFPTTLIVGAVVAATVVGLSLLLYFKKRKQ